MVCFGLHVQHLMELTRPVVKEIGRGGSVEADSGTFYTHYTYNYVVQPRDHNRTRERVFQLCLWDILISKKLLSETMQTMWKQFPVNWLTSF